MRYLKFRSSLIFLSLLLTIPEVLFPQVNRLSDTEFYSGSAEGNNIDAVRASALDNLIQQIQVFVSSSNVRTLSEINSSVKDSTSLTTIMKSSVQLKDLQETVTRLDHGGFRVVKFISKNVVHDIFQKRKASIRDYLTMAERELNKDTKFVDIGLVLKNYYRAYLLSLITQDTLLFTFHYETDKLTYSTSNIIPAIQSALKHVVSHISLIPKKKLQAENLTWKYSADYKGMAISDFRFSYFDGIGEMLGVVNKGETIMEFYFREPETDRELVLSADIAYEDEMDDDLRQAQTFLGDKLGRWEFSTVVPVEGNAVQMTEDKKQSHDRKKANDGENRQQGEMNDVSLVNIMSEPEVIRELIESKDSIKDVLNILNRYEKNNKIITGSGNEFESHKDLYAIVLDESSAVALIKCGNEVYTDLLTQQNVLLKGFAGKRIKWFEVFK